MYIDNPKRAPNVEQVSSYATFAGRFLASAPDNFRLLTQKKTYEKTHI